MQVTTIGLDLAKHVFQIHGIDAAEGTVFFTLSDARHIGALSLSFYLVRCTSSVTSGLLMLGAMQ